MFVRSCVPLVVMMLIVSSAAGCWHRRNCAGGTCAGGSCAAPVYPSQAGFPGNPTFSGSASPSYSPPLNEGSGSRAMPLFQGSGSR
jgi:hypothetical protein